MVPKNFDHDVNTWKMEDNIYKNVLVDSKLYIKLSEHVFHNSLYRMV